MRVTSKGQVTIPQEIRNRLVAVAARFERFMLATYRAAPEGSGNQRASCHLSLACCILEVGKVLMPEWLTLLLVVAAWFALIRFVLPRFGVPT